MNPTYSINQLKRAEKDVIDIYKLAEDRIKLSPIPCSLVQLRNAFQVFRYAFREWAMGKKEGVVLRALMLADARAREVRSVFGAEENVIYCEDSGIAEALTRLLEGDGYEEEA